MNDSKDSLLFITHEFTVHNLLQIVNRGDVTESHFILQQLKCNLHTKTYVQDFIHDHYLLNSGVI